MGCNGREGWTETRAGAELEDRVLAKPWKGISPPNGSWIVGRIHLLLFGGGRVIPSGSYSRPHVCVCGDVCIFHGSNNGEVTVVNYISTPASSYFISKMLYPKA